MKDKDKATKGILTLSREKMQKVASERISEITKEFTDGFKFLEDYPKSVTFFGSNQTKEDDKYYQDARTLAGRIVKELGHSVLTGGSVGIMEAANRGAYEAGGNSLGLLIDLPGGQPTNKYITKSIGFYYFFARKVCLSFGAEMYIFYPGGFGTLDEFFEILTLVQTEKIANIPIVCVGSEYWNQIKKFMVDEQLAHGAIEESDLDLFTITDDHDEVINAIKAVPIKIDVPYTNTDDKAEV